MKYHFAAAVVVAMLFTACNTPSGPGATPASPKPAASTSRAPTSQPSASVPPAASTVDVEAIRQAYKTAAYTRINATPVTSSGAHSGPKFVYVDQANAARYTKAFQGEMPEGATIVKATENESFFAVMKKRPAGADPAADDWYYYETIGSSVVFDGNKTTGGGLCHGCHKSGAAADNLLGLDVYPPN